jgi:hypothetical protein
MSNFESKAAMNMTGSFKASEQLIDGTGTERVEAMLKEHDRLQKEVCEYNKELPTAHMSDISLKTFFGHNVVVKLERFDHLVPIEDTSFSTVNPKKYVQITTPDNPRGMVVTNPFPYNFRGIVVAVGSDVQQDVVPGDYVELRWFNIKEDRYYPNKTLTDEVTVQTPEAPNFEGYVLVSSHVIESKVSRESFEAVFGEPIGEYWKDYKPAKFDKDSLFKTVNEMDKSDISKRRSRRK